MKRRQDNAAGLPLLLRELKLPAFARDHRDASARAEKGGWSFLRFLHHLCDLELAERKTRRIERNLKASCLPSEKTLATLEIAALPVKVRRILPKLCTGEFVGRAFNVLAFGLPGRGKTHLLAAVGHELVKNGYRVLFTPAFKLVQRLLAAKRDLVLERALRKLDRFDVVVLDDIGYVQQNREEMEVLFTFLSERYERRSVLISSNLVFTQWDRIFKDAMTTASAIDRLVHYSIILELTGTSYRQETARKRNESPPPPEPTKKRKAKRK